MSDQRLYIRCEACNEAVLIAAQSSPAWELRVSNEERFNSFMFTHCEHPHAVVFELESEVDYWPELTTFKAEKGTK